MFLLFGQISDIIIIGVYFIEMEISETRERKMVFFLLQEKKKTEIICISIIHNKKETSV